MLWSILPLVSLCFAHPAHVPRADKALTIRKVTQFPNETWIEDIAVRSNGHLLVTELVPEAKLWDVDPSSSSAQPKLVGTFADKAGAVGIAEIQPDVFAVGAGNISVQTLVATPQSFSVFKVDLTKKTPTVSKLFDMPKAGALDGITTASGKPDSDWLLIADNSLGLIWRANWRTGQYYVALNDSTTQIPPNAFIPIGANGVHVSCGELYYTNSNLGYFKVAIDSQGRPTGSPVTVASFAGGDGFALDAAGNTIVARGGIDQMSEVTAAGAVLPLNFTNSDANVLIQGSTSVAFGRTAKDASTIYDVTNGGMSGLVGPAPVGGLVLAFQ